MTIFLNVLLYTYNILKILKMKLTIEEKKELYNTVQIFNKIVNNNCLKYNESHEYIEWWLEYVQRNTKYIVEKCLNCNKNSCLISQKTY